MAFQTPMYDVSQVVSWHFSLCNDLIRFQWRCSVRSNCSHVPSCAGPAALHPDGLRQSQGHSEGRDVASSPSWSMGTTDGGIIVYRLPVYEPPTRLSVLLCKVRGQQPLKP
ncbi:hypothetical protein ILYODFUR_002172 [Ilyodon furcidens]|uniref:Uncharacterized protein n=1 Tax=Ilyodon furcidens TaxID=33524 RepID=A0ABV0SHT4_9TELE